jgi:peptidoglycan-associated lipoprotein
MKQRVQLFTVAFIVGGILLLGGCNKKVAKVVPPPPPPPAAPTATLAASPNVIQQGQSTELTWQTTNANSVTIEGVGDVSASGSRSATPTDSMTYTLVAKGPGGTQEATARVTVNQRTQVLLPSSQDDFAKNIKDVFFDFDRADLRADQHLAADSDGRFLAQHPEIKVLIAGHCDDRGSEEYNLALGDSRANAVKKALIAQGVNADSVKTISYGKEKPFCSDENEQCWQQNRRDHFSFKQ